MRRLTAIFLSFVLVYAGAASALAACVVHHQGHEHHASHGIGERSVDHHAMAEASGSQDSSAPVIHCTPLNQQVGAAKRRTSFELTRSDRIVRLPPASLPEGFPATVGNDLWLEVVFKQIISFSLPIDLSRHLFLLVLRI
jgi:hypothetical protein